MHYYLVKRIGSGTRIDPYRPDLPIDTPFVGHLRLLFYVVATPYALPNIGIDLDKQAIETALENRGITYSDVMQWRVGDG